MQPASSPKPAPARPGDATGDKKKQKTGKPELIAKPESTNGAKKDKKLINLQTRDYVIDACNQLEHISPRLRN